jgi:hypothetical protein
MPQIKNIGLSLTTSDQTAHTVGAGMADVVQNVIVANVDGAAGVAVDVWWEDASDSNAAHYLAKGVVVAAGDALTIAEKLHLEAGDELHAQAGVAGDAELTANYLRYDA